MKIANAVAQEFTGEEGGRLHVEFDPNTFGVRFHISDRPRSHAIDLDPEETARLVEAAAGVEAAIAGDRRAARKMSVTFEGPDDLTLRIYGDTMGEPYRTGISVWLSSPDLHAGMFLESWQADAFCKFIVESAPRPAPAPGI